MAEAELELALGRLKLSKKTNPRKLIKQIALCKVKFNVPVSDSKKIVQLIRPGGNTYGTVISVTQMCKKREEKTCMSKHIVDEMWKQWRIKGGNEKGEENDEDEEEKFLF
jgi:hypothetical protein